jgi:hypothetical protein
VLEAVFLLLEFPSPSRKIFIGSHLLPPLWFAASVLQNGLFCELLEELLQDIEHSVRPLYITRHYVEPGMRDYYTTEVHV